MTPNLGRSTASALKAADISQRKLSEITGISQPTLSRIIAGQRTAKMPEIMLIADATGFTTAQLLGTGIEDRVQYAARAVNGSTMEDSRRRLLYFIELDSYLEDQAIPTQPGAGTL